MIPHLLRLSVLSPEIVPGDPAECLKGIRAELHKVLSLSPDIIILPSHVLCGLSIGELAGNSAVQAAQREALRQLADGTSGSDCMLLLSIAASDGSSKLLLLHKGILSPVGEETQRRFSCGDAVCRVWEGDPLSAALPAEKPDCDLLICLDRAPAPQGIPQKCRNAVQRYSEAAGCAAVLCGCARGESMTPLCFRSFSALYENGSPVCLSEVGRPSFTADVDLDILRAVKREPSAGLSCGSPLPERSGILREVSPEPFLPCGSAEREAALEEYFSLQTASLAGRMKAIGVKHLVIGVSGGLDSALALLVCTAATDRLGLPRSGILGVTMPGFGTTDRTYYNALKLIVGLGAELKEISIVDSVLQHFSDIGHDPELHDVVYENAQARERTQILLDMANSGNALVVGTGDLSEAALGFCTYGGDQIASFNVNSALPKTLIRHLVAHLASNPVFAAEAELLRDILGTPVSPELLPAGGTAPAQKTEEILGPYELHDFFLYYFVRYRLAPSKIYYYALNAFSGRYSPDMIKETLRIFLRRFVASQFKRNCAPDGAAIGPVDLSPSGFRLPSDLTSTILIQDLDTIKNKG